MQPPLLVLCKFSRDQPCCIFLGRRRRHLLRRGRVERVEREQESSPHRTRPELVRASEKDLIKWLKN